MDDKLIVALIVVLIFLGLGSCNKEGFGGPFVAPKPKTRTTL
jgi:hypothetical protein